MITQEPSLCLHHKQEVKETVTTIDEQLKKVISENRIYTSKLVAHLDWHERFKHLIVATSILEKRFILLDEYDRDRFKFHQQRLVLLRSSEGI